MLFRTVTFALLIFGLISGAEAKAKTAPYKYVLEAENEVFSGHISFDAEKGAKVVADALETAEGEGEAVAGEEHYLKVIIVTQTSQKLKTTLITGHPSSKQQWTTQDRSATQSHSGQAFTARLTGSQKQTPTESSKEFSPNSLPADMMTKEEVSVVTTNARPNTRSQTGSSHNVHILNTETEMNMPSTGSLSPAFRNIHPHGHSIHITHLAQDTVHPAVNKRRKRRNIGHNFAISPEDFQPEHLRPTSGSQQPAFLVIDKTDTFYVDPVDNFVKLNNTEHLKDEHIHPITFYVLVVDENGMAVSNPQPFMVYIDRPVEDTSSYPAVPAVFAGVLVLCVIFFAVLIPLVTRAKRRQKQGKPLFKLGSHPSRADLESAEQNKSNMSRNPSEPNWYGNNYFYSYDEEVAKERSEFSSDLKHYSEPSNPPTLQLTKKRKEPLSEKSSSSGVDVSSQGGAEGVSGEDTYNQRL